MVDGWSCSYVASNVGGTLVIDSQSRLQLCGRFVLELAGKRLEERLPGRQGRMLIAYLAVNHGNAVHRDELIDALWPGQPPAGAPAALRVLVSKVRAVVGEDRVAGRSELSLALPDWTRIDVVEALDAVHRAESAIALGEWVRAWGPALSAWFVTRRRFLLDCDAPWIDEWRGRLDDVLDRAMECYATACLHLGGTELPAAERAARALVDHAPFRESGYVVLMETLEARGNVAEALRVYEQLRTTLREELGAIPGAAVREAHGRLLTRG